MKRRIFLSTVGLAIGGMSLTSFANKDSRPNIIFLLTDDQRWDAFGFMGYDYIITPNLDKMAGESVVFDNAYHACPICKPSRASIMLSQYLGKHKCGFDRPTNMTITKDEFSRSYPAVLRNSGYRTYFTGKFAIL